MSAAAAVFREPPLLFRDMRCAPRHYRGRLLRTGAALRSIVAANAQPRCTRDASCARLMPLQDLPSPHSLSLSLCSISEATCASPPRHANSCRFAQLGSSQGAPKGWTASNVLDLLAEGAIRRISSFLVLCRHADLTLKGRSITCALAHNPNTQLRESCVASCSWSR